MFKKAYFILVISLVLAGCEIGPTDVSQNLPTRVIHQLSTGEYSGIAWVSETKVVVEIDKGNKFENQRMCIQQSVNMVDIKTNQLQQLFLPFGDDCRSYAIRDLKMLPNQQAGFVFEVQKPRSLSIKSVDVKTSAETDIYIETPSDLSIDRFSYSPDMRELLLVDVQSPFMKSAIYLLDINGTKTNITLGFLRADFPAWSTRNQIAFFATKPYPGSDDPIKFWYQTENRIDYPWRLYLYDPGTSATEEIPLDIVHPSDLKWSPDGNTLAFAGEYYGKPGVWIVDNITSPDIFTITRIVNGLAAFDFSPDGRSIAFAYIGLQNKV